MGVRGSMQDSRKGWMLRVGVGVLGGLMAAGGARVAAQTQSPSDDSAASKSPVSQSMVIQKRPAPPLTVDSDPVPSPDAGGVPPGPTQLPTSQPDQITQQDGRYTLVSNAYEVRLNASVYDGEHEVDTLPQSAFKVYEDGVAQQIVGFRHEDLPISLGGLIDSSGSMHDKREAG